MKLKDKVALVTGGSQGIGEIIARAYAAEGARVAIVNHSHPERGAQLAEELIEAGGQARAYVADCSLVLDVDRLAAEVADTLGPTDILVNNAGLFDARPIEEVDEESWDRQLDLNLKGCFFLAKAVVPAMKEKRRGKIINVTSIAGIGGFPGAAAYCASKGGLNNLTKALCLELAPFGINVNALAPGNTATPLNEHLQADPEWSANMARRTPTGESFIPAADMAGAAVFLASEESRAVHGVVLPVDSGWRAW